MTKLETFRRRPPAATGTGIAIPATIGNPRSRSGKLLIMNSTRWPAEIARSRLIVNANFGNGSNWGEGRIDSLLILEVTFVIGEITLESEIYNTVFNRAKI